MPSPSPELTCGIREDEDVDDASGIRTEWRTTMDSSFRTRLVTSASAPAYLLRHPDDTQERWLFQNVGPAQIVLTGHHGTGSTTNDLRAGDYLDLKCQAAQVALASEGEPSIVRWMPVS
jgi:hypothetical protein